MSSLLATEERPLVAESPGSIRTRVPISSPTPKALPSLTRVLDSGYESKFKGPQIDYFSIEQPGTVTAAEEKAPLASPHPLHMEHHSSLPSLVEIVTMAAKQDTLAEAAHSIPRAATDSLLLLSKPGLVADDSVWGGGEPQIGLETVTSDENLDESEASFTCRTSAAIERFAVARIILKGDLEGGGSPVDRRMSM